MSNQLKKTLKMPTPKASANVIQTTVGEILAANNAPQGQLSPAQKLAAVPLMGRPAYQVGRFLNAYGTEQQIAHAERLKVFQKLGEETTPGRLEVPPEKLDELKIILAPLMAAPAEIHTPKLPLSLFAEVSTLTGADMAALAPFIEESA